MAQQPKKGVQKQDSKSLKDLRASASPGPDIEESIPVKARGPLAAGIILLLLLIFFGKALSPEKTFNAGDNIASEAVLPYLKAAQAAGQDVPQWIPNIFCGMPSFASLLSTGTRTYDILYNFFNIVRNTAKAVGGGSDGFFMLFHYLIFGFGFYLFLRLARKTSWLVALFGAITAILSTWILTYSMIGHNTKVFAIMCFPYILLAVEKLRSEGLKWHQIVLWTSILGIFIHFLLESTHVQMVYYQMLAVLIYFVTWIIGDIIRKRNLIPVLRTGILTLLMAGLAFAMSADRYMASLAYDPYSIRGASPLVEKNSEGEATNKLADKSKKAGLDWDYATSYSFSPGEMITFIVPGWYGFGKMPYSGPEVGGVETSVPTYWGQMLGTDAANYTGIIVFVLAIIGIITLWKKDRLIAPLAFASIFGLFLSFGSNLPILYRPMYEFFPGFNKFRAPMMALIMMQLSFPILAALTLENIIKASRGGDDKLKRSLAKFSTWAMYALAALFVIFLAGRGAFEGSLKNSLAASGKPIAQYPDSLKDLAISTALNDAAICTLIGTIAFVLLSFYLKGRRFSTSLVLGGLLVLTVIDQWRVGTRPFEVTTKTELEETLKAHDYVDFIKNDKSLYRVLDLGESTSNVPVAWGTQTIAGYHAAKVRRFQDVVDVTGNAGGQVIFNPFMWSLLNTKYVIADGAVDTVAGRFSLAFMSKEKKEGRDGKPKQTLVWQNNQVLPRVFFVNRFEVKQPLPMLEAMRDGSFNPRDVMFFDEEPKDIGHLAPTLVNDSTESIMITKYTNEFIEMKAKASGDRLAFFSDTWYPSWTATIDGKSLAIYRGNYAFRAFIVPAGEHTIKWDYHDQAYETGRSISLGANVIAILGLVVGIGMGIRKKPL
jgi:hypothetical protein